MQYQDNIGYITKSIQNSNQKDRVFYLAYLSSMAIILSILEYLIPKPLPWMKIGLSNAITLYAFGVVKPKEVFYIVLARVLSVSLLIGTFLSTTFILSLTGAIASYFIMLLLFRHSKKIFSLVGISVIGALTSSFSQLFVVNYLFINSQLSYYLLPVLGGFALVGGIITGYFAEFLARNI